MGSSLGASVQPRRKVVGAGGGVKGDARRTTQGGATGSEWQPPRMSSRSRPPARRSLGERKGEEHGSVGWVERLLKRILNDRDQILTHVRDEC